MTCQYRSDFINIGKARRWLHPERGGGGVNCCSGASLGCDIRQDGNEFPSSYHNELRAGLMEPELNGNGKTPERELF